MSALNLDTFVAIPIPIDLYAELSRRYPSGISSVIQHVAWDFLDRTADDFDAVPRGSNGIHWGSLFLPEGTEVRTKYFNEYKVAIIKGMEIDYEGEIYPSMSQLARAMRGDTSINAWGVMEIKRPSDTQWQSANFLRR